MAEHKRANSGADGRRPRAAPLPLNMQSPSETTYNTGVGKPAEPLKEMLPETESGDIRHARSPRRASARSERRDQRTPIPMRAASIGVLFLCLHACDGFYLPGVAPRDYLPGERVDLKVNKLSSTKTQLVRTVHSSALPPAARCRPGALLTTRQRCAATGSPTSTICCPSASPRSWRRSLRTSARCCAATRS